MTERLLVRGLTASFGGTVVLDDAHLVVQPGEVHGLIGQNGSGKSTLIKLLSGFYRPDRGEVFVDGHQLRLPANPKQLQQYGVSFVHQDLGLVPTLSVAENVRVGRFTVGRWTRRVNWRKERQAVTETLERLRAEIPLDASVGLLSTSQKAVLALARALQGYQPGRGCIILDESTQVLPRETLPEFYAMIRELSAEGTAFLVVSHRLDEIMRMTDRVTVLRDGAVVQSSLDIAGTSSGGLANAMLGANLGDADIRVAHPAAGAGIAAEFTALRGANVHDVSFAVKAGEVLGVTGLTDSGVGELPYLISGAKRARSGTVRLAAGVELDLSHEVLREMLDAGVLLVPADRGGAGLAMPISVLDNITLSTLDSHPWRWISRKRQRADFKAIAEDLDIRPRRSDIVTARLSGGNQQKVLLGKWLLREPSVLVLHEPAQAVDVGARRDLLTALRRRAQQGAAIVICSVEPEDLSQVCDRVLVLGGGRLRYELNDDLAVKTIAGRIWDAGTSPAEKVPVAR
jgi:ribose transport system ATP-binding protein